MPMGYFPGRNHQYHVGQRTASRIYFSTLSLGSSLVLPAFHTGNVLKARKSLNPGVVKLFSVLVYVYVISQSLPRKRVILLVTFTSMVPDTLFQ